MIPGIAEQGEARVSTIGVMDNDTETLATALYVKIDDMLTDWPDLARTAAAAGHRVGQLDLVLRGSRRKRLEPGR
jgi:hypothetical protein